MPSINDNIVSKSDEVIAKAEQIRVLADDIASQPTIARLDTIISLLEGGDMGLVGAAFPEFPTLGHPFWKEGNGRWAYWTGSLWIDIPESVVFTHYAAVPYAGTAPANLAVAAGYGGENTLLVGAYVSLFVATTNNASNYWTIGVDDVATTPTATVSTADVAANTWKHTYVAVSKQTTQPLLLRVNSKTGSPGSIIAIARAIIARIRT